MSECPTCGAPVRLEPDGDPRYDQGQLLRNTNLAIVIAQARIAELEAQVAKLQAVADAAWEADAPPDPRSGPHTVYEQQP